MTTPITAAPPARPGTLTTTVVICCYTEKRKRDLSQACTAVRRQLRPGDELVVVVDHNPALLTWARARLDGARVVAAEGRPGLSQARNTGVTASTGDVVVFLDDDAEPRPGWLDRLRAVFGDGDVAVAGTTVTPRWEGGSAPAWFPDEFGWVVGCSYRGQPTGREVVRNPIGASMAVRRSLFPDVGGFSEVVGRVGALPVGCEETEFCIRTAQRRAGAKVMLEPGAAVDHFVPASRQTLGYFVRRCYHEGRSKRAVARLGGRQAALSAERRYVRAVLPAGVLRGIAESARRPASLLRSSAIVLGLAATVAGYATAGTGRADR